MERPHAPESVRFTSAQRDALLDLAARLQSEHEATVNAQEIDRAAAEAGIDPRFVHEAARRLESVPPDASADRRQALVAFGALAVFDGLFLGITVRHWFFPISHTLQVPLILAAAVGFSMVYSRYRALRWIAVLAPLAIWLSIGVASVIAYRLHGSTLWLMVPRLALTYGMLQALSAAFVAGLAEFSDRSGSRR